MAKTQKTAAKKSTAAKKAAPKAAAKKTTAKKAAPATPSFQFYNIKADGTKGAKISVAKAKEAHYAKVKTGEPTQYYLHQLANAERIANGQDVVKYMPLTEDGKRRERAEHKRYEIGSEKHNGVKSPFSLSRPSGTSMLWQVLADNKGKAMSYDELNAEVNARLAAQHPEYYAKRVNGNFDAEKNIVVLRAGATAKRLAELSQWVVLVRDKESAQVTGVKLHVGGKAPELKRGRPAGVKNPATEAPAVEVTDDNGVETDGAVEAEAAVSAEAETANA